MTACIGRGPRFWSMLASKVCNDARFSSDVYADLVYSGTSKAALDVLAGVTSDFLFNVGRTIAFLADKHGSRMTAEEIILHTLFESGIARMSELERYVKDEIIRHGSRLTELEKKLANAYNEAVSSTKFVKTYMYPNAYIQASGEAWDDEALFKEEDEEEEGEFVMGNFADSLGDDFLGLRELGIAEEFGLSSLSVPKKLLKGKNKGAKEPAVYVSQPSTHVTETDDSHYTVRNRKSHRYPSPCRLPSFSLTPRMSRTRLVCSSHSTRTASQH